MITVRKRNEGTEGSSSLVKLSDDELVDVAGGYGKVVDLGDNVYELSYQCDGCCEHREVFAVLSANLRAEFSGVYTCPKCGYTREYEVRPNEKGMATTSAPRYSMRPPLLGL